MGKHFEAEFVQFCHCFESSTLCCFWSNAASTLRRSSACPKLGVKWFCCCLLLSLQCQLFSPTVREGWQQRFCGFFQCFLVLPPHLGVHYTLHHLCWYDHVSSQHTNVLLLFLIDRSSHNTFQTIASLERYFFPSRSNVTLKHEIVFGPLF